MEPPPPPPDLQRQDGRQNRAHGVDDEQDPSARLTASDPRRSGSRLHNQAPPRPRYLSQQSPPYLSRPLPTRPARTNEEAVPEYFPYELRYTTVHGVPQPHRAPVPTAHQRPQMQANPLIPDRQQLEHQNNSSNYLHGLGFNHTSPFPSRQRRTLPSSPHDRLRRTSHYTLQDLQRRTPQPLPGPQALEHHGDIGPDLSAATTRPRSSLALHSPVIAATPETIRELFPQDPITVRLPPAHPVTYTVSQARQSAPPRTAMPIHQLPSFGAAAVEVVTMADRAALFGGSVRPRRRRGVSRVIEIQRSETQQQPGSEQLPIRVLIDEPVGIQQIDTQQHRGSDQPGAITSMTAPDKASNSEEEEEDYVSATSTLEQEYHQASQWPN